MEICLEVARADGSEGLAYVGDGHVMDLVAVPASGE